MISVVIDHYQESKAENAAELLKEKVSTTATVVRDNTKKESSFPKLFQATSFTFQPAT